MQNRHHITLVTNHFATNQIWSKSVTKRMRQGGIEPPARLRHEMAKPYFTTKPLALNCTAARCTLYHMHQNKWRIKRQCAKGESNPRHGYIMKMAKPYFTTKPLAPHSPRFFLRRKILLAFMFHCTKIRRCAKGESNPRHSYVIQMAKLYFTTKPLAHTRVYRKTSHIWLQQY